MHDRVESLLEWVCRKPGMYVQSVRYETVCAYLDGYDLALCGGPLSGFREWLLAEGDEWTNLSWWGLIRRLEFPDADPASPLTTEQSDRLLAALTPLLERFLVERRRDGLSGVFHKYHLWLMARTDETTALERERLRAQGWPNPR